MLGLLPMELKACLGVSATAVGLAWRDYSLVPDAGMLLVIAVAGTILGVASYFASEMMLADRDRMPDKE